MRIGRPARNWTLYAVASRSVQPFVERRQLDVERQEGGVLELAERPLEGVRDEVDLLGADHRARTGRRSQVDGHDLVADQPPVGDQALREPAGEERVPVVDRGLVDLAVENAVPAVHEPAGVAKRPRIAV